MPAPRSGLVKHRPESNLPKRIGTVLLEKIRADSNIEKHFSDEPAAVRQGDIKCLANETRTLSGDVDITTVQVTEIMTRGPTACESSSTMKLITEASSSMQQGNSVQDVAAELPPILDLPELTDEPSGHSQLGAEDLIDIHIDKALAEEIGCSPSAASSSSAPCNTSQEGKNHHQSWNYI